MINHGNQGRIAFLEESRDRQCQTLSLGQQVQPLPTDLLRVLQVCSQTHTKLLHQ